MDPDLSVCDWHGVICSSSEIKSVESIHLMKNGLFGNISGSIYELESLEEINLAFNDVNLSFSGINKAKNLEYINLDSTFLKSLSGIEQASNLKLLHVMDNDFGDTFPNEITLVPSLEVLFLSDNLDWKYASPHDNLLNLRFFACERCGLEGNLPALLGL
jgi:Leucine-rich repeat (LRR) protein